MNSAQMVGWMVWIEGFVEESEERGGEGICACVFIHIILEVNAWLDFHKYVVLWIYLICYKCSHYRLTIW